MVNGDLVDYIQKAKASNLSQTEIVSTLLQLGWELEDVNDSMQVAAPDRLAWIKQHWRWFAVGGLILVLLIIAAVMAYFVYINPIQNTTATVQPAVPPQPSEQSPPPNAVSTSIPEANQPALIECNDDMNCLVEASKTCSPAQGVMTQEVELFGITVKSKSQLKIGPRRDEKCTLYMQAGHTDLQSPDGKSLEIDPEVQKEMTKVEGSYRTCLFDQSDLTALLAQWSQGKMNSGEVSCHLSSDGQNSCTTKGGDFAKATCEGTYPGDTPPSDSSNIGR
ncbi:hypothetical protein BH09PAT2_BH09PAT2_07090 [soil metagenome]